MKSFSDSKKYILISSGIIFFGLFVHLVGAYLYTGGKFIGIPEGSISIGMIGKSPDVKNPFLYGTSQQNNLVYDFLFRSLITYNPHKKLYEWDLATCDLADLTNVTCTLREDAIWSDGSEMKTQDIIATYTAFSEQSENAKMKTFLEGLKVEKTGTGVVTFSTTEKSSMMIEALEYPIVRSDMVDQIKNERLKNENYISSGPFLYKETVDDETYKFQRVTFEKNPNYQGVRWLERLNFKFFDDAAALERAIDTVTVVIPPKLQENLNVGPRFDSIIYNKNYEIFGAFFKENALPKNVQKIVYAYLYNAFYRYELANENHKKMTGIFSSESYSPPEIKTDIQTTMKANGYQTKQMLREEAMTVDTSFSGAVVYDTLEYFTNGGGQAILYTEAPEGAVRLTGNIPNNITSVTINDYTLQEYQKWSGQFIYKVSLENASLKKGKNTFDLVLQREGAEPLTESLTIYYTTDADEMESYKKEVADAYNATQNTPEKIAEREAKKQEILKTIEALDDNAYYNADFEKLTIRVAYVPGVLDEYLEFVASTLSQMSIQVEKIPLEGPQIAQMIETNEKPYDIILIGMEAPANLGQILQNFESNQVEKGINFSNIENSELDALIEILHITTDTVILEETKQKIEKLLVESSSFISFSSPYHTFYVDKNIKWLDAPKELKNIQSLAEVLDTVSIKDRYELNLEGKSFGGFFGWLAENFKNQ